MQGFESREDNCDIWDSDLGAPTEGLIGPGSFDILSRPERGRGGVESNDHTRWILVCVCERATDDTHTHTHTHTHRHTHASNDNLSFILLLCSISIYTSFDNKHMLYSSLMSDLILICHFNLLDTWCNTINHARSVFAYLLDSLRSIISRTAISDCAWSFVSSLFQIKSDETVSDNLPNGVTWIELSMSHGHAHGLRAIIETNLLKSLHPKHPKQISGTFTQLEAEKATRLGLIKDWREDFFSPVMCSPST